MRLRQCVILAAGLLIALRLFFPVEGCDFTERAATGHGPSNCEADEWPGIRRVMTSVTVMQALGIATVVGAIMLAERVKGR